MRRWARFPPRVAGVFAELRRGRYLALLAFCLVLAATCTAAGGWQVDRYGEKRRANAALRANDEQAPTPVGDVLRTDQPAEPRLRFRRVTATGRYDPGGQVLVRLREVDSQIGYLVVTPLRTAGGALLVVRGFVPARGSATETPAVPDPPAGTVEVTGRVFPSEDGRSQSGLPAGQVDRIDVPALAARLGAATYGGYVELISSRPADTGLVATPGPDLSNPAGGALEGQHLAYIVQWFFFALLALAGPFVIPTLDRRAAAAADAERVQPEPVG